MNIVEVSSQAAEDTAFASGVDGVIRTDLLSANNDIYLNFDGVNGSKDILCDDISNNIVFNIGGCSRDTSVKKFGTASLKTGIGQYLVIPKSNGMDFSQDFTMEVDVKLSVANNNNWTFLASFGIYANLNSAWYVAIRNSTIVFCNANNHASISATYPYYTDITNLHNVSLDRVGDTISLYAGGNILGSTTDIPYNGVGDLYVGGWNYTTANTNGANFDEFKLTSNRALRTGNFTPDTVPFKVI